MHFDRDGEAHDICLDTGCSVTLIDKKLRSGSVHALAAVELQQHACSGSRCVSFDGMQALVAESSVRQTRSGVDRNKVLSSAGLPGIIERGSFRSTRRCQAWAESSVCQAL